MEPTFKYTLVKQNEEYYIIDKNTHVLGYSDGKNSVLDINEIEDHLCHYHKNSVDVEALALKKFKILMVNGDEYWIPRYDCNEKNREIFIEAFNKGFNLNADKEFTLEDMKTAIEFGFEKCKKFGDITKPEMSTFLSSFKKEQSEWEVEAELCYEYKVKGEWKKTLLPSEWEKGFKNEKRLYKIKIVKIL